MVDAREGLVEMVQRRLPVPVALGAAETLGVVLEARPPDQQQVAVRVLDAGPYLESLEAFRGSERYQDWKSPLPSSAAFMSFAMSSCG